MINLRSIYVFFGICIGTEVFVTSKLNTFGIVGSREFLILLSGSLILFIALHSRINKIMFYHIIFSIFFCTFSAVLANKAFGQPIVHGVLEERRSLMIVISILIFLLLRGSDPKKIQSTFIAVAFVITFLLVFSHLGIGVDFRDLSQIDSTSDAIELNRMGVPRLAGVLGILGIHLLYRDRNSSVGWVCLTISFINIFLFLKTRNLFIVIILSYLVISSQNFNLKKFMTTVAGSIVFVIIMLSAETLFAGRNLFIANVEDMGARAGSVAITFQEIGMSWLGKGALSSSLFNGGFPEYYHFPFYLADIGVFGWYYRFGLTGLILFAINFWMIWKLKLPYETLLLKSIRWYILIKAPLSGLVAYEGSLIGLLIALYIIEKTHWNKQHAI